MEEELLKLDVSNVDKHTLDFMEKLSSVTLDDNKLLTPEELVDQFRKSFNIQGENADGHNILENNEDGVLCFDLMICANPLSKEKKQMFYTFFSTKDVSDSKKALAKLYEYYLKKKPRCGIDTMLQICYSASEIEKRVETKGKSIKKGVMLDFTEDGRMCVCLIDQAEKEFNLEKDRIKKNESVRKTSATSDDDSQRFEVLENYIESVVNDDKTKSSYSSYVDAFLDITSTDADSCLSEEDIQKNAYRISLINELAVPGLKRLYFVPIPFPNDSLIGHIVVSTNGTKAKDEEIKLINKYKTLAFVLMFPLVQANISMFYMRNQRREAIKSAKAAIMSRNLSHNLGSHVMSYMKQSLTSVEEMVKSGALEQVHKKTETISNEMPFLVGMGKFLSYLQERQDYIATVSTDYIPYPSIVNFKDSIYDELNPDYRFHRHSEHRSGFKPANLLLENIAKSEGLSRKNLDSKETQEENNIFINYKDFNGINQDDATNAYNDLRKWNFSLPGGIMGRQAVFSIVENVIRNAAKHGKRNKGDNLTVTFDIIDPLACSDEIRKDSFFNRFLDSSNKDYGDLYIVTLTASTQADEGVIRKIRTAIDDARNPVDDDFNLKQSNKGIKEMFISASWLRSLRIEDMDRDDLDGLDNLDKMSPILEVREYKGKLQYVFCLPKVKEVAVVSDSIKVDDATDGLMRRCGWRVLSYQVYLDPETKKNYNFVIIDDASKMEEIRKCSHNNFFVASDCTDLREHRIKTKVIEDIRNSRRKPNTFAITEDSLKEAEIKLYKELSACKDISIAICDKENFNSYQQHKKNVETEIEIIENEECEKTKEYRYFYRKHNDSEEQFKDFIKKIYGIDNFKHNLEFVEGISGGNSTDRLVRHSELDDTWAYKQIHAMKTKVAIFDERIFAKFAGFDPNERTSKKENTWSARLKKAKDIDEAIRIVTDYDDSHNKNVKDDLVFELLACDTMDKIIDFANMIYPLSEDRMSIMPLVLHKKGIDIFTLIPDNNTNNFEIWGYDTDSFSGDNKSINFGEVRKLGVLSLRDEDGHWSPEIRTKGNYHQYLTIHQGLLDKIYEKMQDGERDQSNKLKVTQKLYNAFGYGGSTESDWLQGLVIHSGRSKPNAADMPQNQPFIQYSALENAVYDCKYTLVELLDYACFEDNN